MRSGSLDLDRLFRYLLLVGWGSPGIPSLVVLSEIKNQKIRTFFPSFPSLPSHTLAFSFAFHEGYFSNLTRSRRRFPSLVSVSSEKAFLTVLLDSDPCLILEQRTSYLLLFSQLASSHRHVSFI